MTIRDNRFPERSIARISLIDCLNPSIKIVQVQDEGGRVGKQMIEKVMKAVEE